MKLTRPQMELLRELAESPSSISTGYKPLLRLLDLKLVRPVDPRQVRFEPTDAGRQALKEQEKGE